MDTAVITEHLIRTGDHETFYMQSGPDDGPAIVFVHGWPELSLSWRHMLPCFGALGFRAVAPDLRGFGRSTVYRTQDAYAVEHVVGDMRSLLDTLGVEKAVWVGHDWGSAPVWSMASHHPERCHAVVNLCIPYRTIERGIELMLPLVDRTIYPESEHPFGQWAYMRFFHERFERATAVFDAAPFSAVKAIFRRGNPDTLGGLPHNINVFRDNGWFGGADRPPDIARDDAIITDEDLRSYAESLRRNGFFGPNAYYMNDAANLAYSERSANGGYIDLPALFIAARYDIVCEAVDSRLADPMKAFCRNLTTDVVMSGHRMALEKPSETNSILARWLAINVPESWPTRR